MKKSENNCNAKHKREKQTTTQKCFCAQIMKHQHVALHRGRDRNILKKHLGIRGYKMPNAMLFTPCGHLACLVMSSNHVYCFYYTNCFKDCFNLIHNEE